MKNELVTYMGHHWILVEDNSVLVGMTEEAINEIDKIQEINLPNEGEEVEADDVCGEIETPDGTYKLYSPVNGSVAEVNADVVEDTSLLFDDPYDCWLYRIEAADDASLDALLEREDEDA
jgi:glycine cleavage system H protein